MDVVYTWILGQGKIVVSIWIAISPVIYWSICLPRKRGGDGVKGFEGGYLILARYKFHSIRVHDSLL